MGVKQERRRSSPPIVPPGRQEQPGDKSFTLITLPALPIGFLSAQCLVQSSAVWISQSETHAGCTNTLHTNIHN